MSTTIKSTETPELELVSIAEDALVQNDEQILDNVDTLDSATADSELVEQVVDTEVAGKSKAELVDMLAEVLEGSSVEDIRSQVEQGSLRDLP